MKIGDTPPERALAEVEARFPGALQRQFVPLNPALWKLEHFDEFLIKRRELIAQAFNDLMKGLAAGPVGDTKRPVRELIEAGESGGLEFKSTLRWDVQKKQRNKELSRIIAKTVAGFMNGEGGTLLIGVADDGSIYGIEDDLTTLSKANPDGFELALVQTIGDYLGGEYAPYYDTEFESVDGRTVCRLEIDRSPKPVYLSNGGATEFYVRNGNQTQPLDMQAAVDYIGMHWES